MATIPKADEIPRPGSHLTVNDVRMIRALSKAGYKNKKIAKMFFVDSSTISRIVNRKAWTDVD